MKVETIISVLSTLRDNCSQFESCNNCCFYSSRHGCILNRLPATWVIGDIRNRCVELKNIEKELEQAE